jgi:mannonate dehydratase
MTGTAARHGSRTITDVDVVVCSPGRNYVTLRLGTADGLVGWGDATLNGRELAVASYLRDHVAPLLLGKDASRIGDLWQYLYRGPYWRRGPVTMASISAVDQALWDVQGKAAGMPVFQLLGGRARERLMTYPHASGHSVEDAVASIAGKLEEGYAAVRVQASVPGLPSTYGIHVGDEAYEPAHTDLPDEEAWNTTLYLDFVPKLMQRVRHELGFGFNLLHDGHHRLTPTEAAWLGKELEPQRLFWLEDVTPAEDQKAFASIKAHTTTPLAVGEVFNSIWDCQELISNRWIDYIRCATTHTGGITHMKRIMDLADLYGVRSGCHGPSDVSPVGMAANVHLGFAIPNFGVQEFMGYPDATAEVFTTSYRLVDGHLEIDDDVPGLGVEVDLEAAERYPYDRKYLPVNRRLDGSMHDW